MKKLFILSLMALTAVSAEAQRKRTRTATSQGNIVLRAGLGFGTEKSDPDGESSVKTNTISFNPSVGYMVVDNLELGVNLGISNENTEDIRDLSPVLDKSNINTTMVNFGLYAQKYFPLNNWFSFTATADLGLSTGSFNRDDIFGPTTTNNKGASGSVNGIGGALSGGIAFTPYNAFALQANLVGLGVQNMKTDTDVVGVGPTNYTNFGFNVWRQPMSVTAVWYLGRGLWKK